MKHSPLSIVMVLSLCGMLAGCRTPAPITPPEPVQLVMAPPRITDGSLWQAEQGRHGIVADNTARNKGDLVTILIIEETSAKRDRTTDTSRKQAIDASAEKLVYSDLLKRKGELPGVKLGTTRSFNASGSVENTETVEATLSAQVTDVMPNGNLVLMGQKKIIIAGDTQVVTLTGIVRPEDVSSNNTVVSGKIAEARINIYGNGTLSDSQRRTLVGRVLDWVNLF